MFMKNGNESWDVLSDSRKRYRGPWAEIGKYWPGKEPIRLQDSLPCPLKKKIKIISGPFQPQRKLHSDEGCPNLPSPPPSLRNRAICNPPMNRPVAELHASASLEVRPPCVFITQAGLKRKPGNQVSATPPKSAALDSLPNSKRPLEFPIHARRNFLPAPQIQRDKHVMQL